MVDFQLQFIDACDDCSLNVTVQNAEESSPINACDSSRHTFSGNIIIEVAVAVNETCSGTLVLQKDTTDSEGNAMNLCSHGNLLLYEIFDFV